MSNFYDRKHSIGEIVFQGAHEENPSYLCNKKVQQALETWQKRENRIEPRQDLLQLDNSRSFTIDYNGSISHYWPDEKSNSIGENLVREFLFRDGICKLDDLEVRLYAVKYKVIAMDDTEYLLVCPFPAESNNISGIVVVCVNQYLA